MPDLRRFPAIATFAGAMLALLLIQPLPQARAQDASAYAVADATTGKILLTQSAGKRLSVGSLTNIATAMVVLDWLDIRHRSLTEQVDIPAETMAFPQNPIGFEPGDKATVKDLLYAALMQSDDIAAYALAMHVGRDLPLTTGESPMQAFIAQMNALSRKLGMKNTIFVDATGMGLNERRPPYSTALDMAQLARYAMNRPQFRFYVSQKQRVITLSHESGESSGYNLVNTNELLGVDGIDGVKTSTTRSTGPCLVISAAKAPESVQQGEKYLITPRRLVVVLLGSQNRFATAHGLLVEGWQAYDQWEKSGRPMRGG